MLAIGHAGMINDIENPFKALWVMLLIPLQSCFKKAINTILWMLTDPFFGTGFSVYSFTHFTATTMAHDGFWVSLGSVG